MLFSLFYQSSYLLSMVYIRSYYINMYWRMIHTEHLLNDAFAYLLCFVQLMRMEKYEIVSRIVIQMCCIRRRK